MLHGTEPAAVPEVSSSKSVFRRLPLVTETLLKESRSKLGQLKAGTEPEGAAPQVIAYEDFHLSGQRRRVHRRPQASRRDILPPHPGRIQLLRSLYHVTTSSHQDCPHLWRLTDVSNAHRDSWAAPVTPVPTHLRHCGRRDHWKTYPASRHLLVDKNPPPCLVTHPDYRPAR